jgi:hypothetical protein
MPDPDPRSERLVVETAIAISRFRGHSTIGDVELAEARELLDAVLRERANGSAFDAAALIA